MSTQIYNGWKNRQTWNVALWVQNDEGLYNTAIAYLQASKRRTWHGFIAFAGLSHERTPDGIAYLGTRLDYRALNGMLRDMVS